MKIFLTGCCLIVAATAPWDIIHGAWFWKAAGVVFLVSAFSVADNLQKGYYDGKRS